MPPVVPKNPRGGNTGGYAYTGPTHTNPPANDPAIHYTTAPHNALGVRSAGMNQQYNTGPDHPPAPTAGGGNPKGPWMTLARPPAANTQTPQGARLIQQWLNKHGSNLVVDGIWGPRSQAAYSAYAKRAGIKPPPTNVTPPKPRGGNASPPPAPGGRAPAGGGAGGGGGNQQQQRQQLPPGLDQLQIAGHSIPDIVAQILKGNPVNAPAPITPQHVDPLAFAASQAQLQYGPQVAGAQRQLGATLGQLDPTLANISRSFAPALQAAQAAGANNQATAAGAQSTQDTTAQALASIPGVTPEIVQALGQNADVGKTLLAQQAQAQAGLDNAQATDIQNLTGQYKGAATVQTNAAADQIRGQLLDAIAQRANSIPGNIVQAQTLNDQFRSNAIADTAQQSNTALSQALAGPQVTASRLGNVTNAAGLLEQLVNDRFQRGVTVNQQTNANAAAQDAHQTTILNNRIKTLQARWAGQDRTRVNKPAPFYTVVQDPKTSQALSNAVWSGGLVNPNTGGLANGVSPGDAYTTILSRLHSQFPTADKSRLQNWAKGQVLPFAKNAGWVWKNNGFRQVGGTATVPIG